MASNPSTQNAVARPSDLGPAAAVIGRRYLWLGMCKNPFRRKLDDGKELLLSCGKCLACRIRRRSVWTIRLLHENECHEKSRFITLTYNETTLPRRGSDPRGILVKSDLQNFFKRYRKLSKIAGLKYYACGEIWGKWAGRIFTP